MRRITAGICLVAGVVSSGVPPALSEDAVQAESALIDQATLPDAIDLKGARPKADPSVLAPAVDALPPPSSPLAAPASLALPDASSQVRIHELRPLTLEEAIQLAEFNSPKLKAAASQVDQAKSALTCSHLPPGIPPLISRPVACPNISSRTPTAIQISFPGCSGKPQSKFLDGRQWINGMDSIHGREWRPTSVCR